MKKIFFILAAMAFVSCSSNDKSTSKSDSTASAKPVEDKPSSAWHYQTDTDKMTSKQRFYAQVDATNKLQFEFPYSGGSTGSIIVRNTNGKRNEITIYIDKGQFQSGEDHGVNVKFDTGSPIAFKSSEPSDGSTDLIFLEPAKTFVSHLKKAKKVIVQADFFEGGTKEMEFDVEGLKWDH